jgi:hypothetical protein
MFGYEYGCWVFPWKVIENKSNNVMDKFRMNQYFISSGHSNPGGKEIKNIDTRTEVFQKSIFISN